MRIINKSGPLHNPADRDHSLQYAVAIGLLFGKLESRHYSDKVAADPRIDDLRGKMQAREDKGYSRDYLDPDKRSIANGMAIHFDDGSVEELQIEYPVGHRQRRNEAKPLLEAKFRTNLQGHFPAERIDALQQLMLDQERLLAMPVNEFMDLWICE